MKTVFLTSKSSPMTGLLAEVLRKACVASLISISAGAFGAQIGLNFLRGAGGDVPDVQNTLANSLLATDMAGEASYAQANWNNLGYQGTNIVDVDNLGAATSVSMSWTSPNA